MRASLLSSFNTRHIVNLHGNTQRGERNPDGGADDNVFDIKQGVAISLLCKTPSLEESTTYQDLWGSRQHKYSTLAAPAPGTQRSGALSPMPEYFFLVPKRFDLQIEYDEATALTSMFVQYGNGIETDRDELFFGFTRADTAERLKVFFSTRGLDSEFRRTYRVEDSSSYRLLDRRRKSSFNAESVRECLYRPFDIRWLYYQHGLTSRPASEVMQHLLGTDNLALLACRQQAEMGFQHAYCSKTIVERCSVSLKTREVTSVFPLWLRPVSEAPRLDGAPRLNFSPPFLSALSARLGARRSTSAVLPEGVTGESIFHYVYCILHSPTYRTRYAEFLKIGFPRVPLTSDLELFRALDRLGGELVALHLLESPLLDSPITRYVGRGDDTVAAGHPKYADGKVWINSQQGFEGVPAKVWEFQVGSYQVCQKWLKDRRGRVLSAEDQAHYARVVVALHETIRLMREIDAVIDAHGGWPIR
jgi:predicted helicase